MKKIFSAIALVSLVMFYFINEQEMNEPFIVVSLQDKGFTKDKYLLKVCDELIYLKKPVIVLSKSCEGSVELKLTENNKKIHDSIYITHYFRYSLFFEIDSNILIKETMIIW